MAICARCEIEEADLHENGVAVCQGCANASPGRCKPSPSEQEIRALLLQDVLRAHYRLNNYMERGIVPEDLQRAS